MKFLEIEEAVAQKEKVQGYRGTGVQAHRGTGVQGYRGRGSEGEGNAGPIAATGTPPLDLTLPLDLTQP